jgi:hypothetical protein
MIQSPRRPERLLFAHAGRCRRQVVVADRQFQRPYRRGFMGSRNGGRKRPPFHLSFDAPKESGEPLSHGRARPAAFVQPIAIFRGWACFAFGRVSVNTPSSRLALIFS